MYFQRFTVQPKGFHIMFDTYLDKKNIESLVKNPQYYENSSNETDVYEQKPIKIDYFNEAEKKRNKRAR